MDASRPTYTPPDVEAVLSLVGSDLVVLHSPFELQVGKGGGGDIDCVVLDPDPYWPLRLPSGWSLCQRLRYDITGTYYVLDHDGEAVAVDLLVDPAGIGKYGFADRSVFGRTTGLDAATRAVYLTAKRLRKGIYDAAAWRTIGELASVDPPRFRDLLVAICGRPNAEEVASYSLAGTPPPRDVTARFVRRLDRRRWRSPNRAVRIAVKSVARYASRILRPTGFMVVVAGPDGAGKSTVADVLQEGLSAFFRRGARFHWRPGLLPSLSSLARASDPDVSNPHDRVPRSPIGSTVTLLYYWTDFLLGGWGRLRPAKSRSSFIVWERGWWDMHVDPLRYRLTRFPLLLMRTLAVPLVKPDLHVVLEGDPDELSRRKQEITAAEVRRQLQAWRALEPVVRPVFLNTSRDLKDTLGEARRIIVDRLDHRQMKYVGAGWLSLGGSPCSPRWFIPRGPRRAAATSLRMYQPVTPKGLIGWSVAWAAARTGLSRIPPRGSAPPAEVRSSLAPHLPARCTLSVARANHPLRFIAVALRADGTSPWLAKVAFDEHGREKLDAERIALQTYARHLEPPLSAPRVLHASDGVLLLEPIRWRPRIRPATLPVELARALGSFYARGSTEGVDAGGYAHGDCTPWNVLRTDRGWVLVDWEDAESNASPFHDLFHYLVQGHALLGKPGGADLHSMLSGEGPLAGALFAYSGAAKVSPEGARSQFIAYLESSRKPLLGIAREDANRGVRARDRLLDALMS